MRYKRKSDWIIPFVNGKKVLDLGCVKHKLEESKNPDWLHGIIKKHARSLLGVDYLEEAVSALKQKGYNMVSADVETIDLGDKFEVIMAGDIIEHLSNCGKFMKKVREHLTPEGTCLITVPNPLNLLAFIQMLIYGRVVTNPEHTCWFTRNVLEQLAGRHGFEITNVAYVDDAYLYYKLTFFWAPIIFLNRILCFLRPQFCETLCFAIKLTDEGKNRKDK